ncbi:universal stress protein [Salinibacter grassmerensis]|uniref:universal stress protein n=1 Tax=Salinibacter grassmerensis TaxID=3040353 RepID=UPI0021E8689F|nr:universal stress protein [Salinibacter grassmerensis]
MLRVDRILFPTDGSECAGQAHRHAQHLAAHFDAALHVISVEEHDVDPDEVIEVEEASLQARVHGVEPGGGALPAARLRERAVTHPTAAGGILNYVVQYDVDLVVMGTHGRRGLRRLVLGSVAEEAVRKAPCPVLTVGRGAVAPQDMEGGTLLVPVDFSEHRFRLMAHAREIAPVYGMDLTLLHVVDATGLPNAYGAHGSPPDPGVLSDRAEEVLDVEAESLRTKGIEVTLDVRGGHPAAEVLDVAEERGAAFIAIATHGRTGLERMLMGSVAEKVLRRAPCPVCAVKSFGRSLVDGHDSAGA